MPAACCGSRVAQTCRGDIFLQPLQQPSYPDFSRQQISTIAMHNTHSRVFMNEQVPKWAQALLMQRRQQWTCTQKPQRLATSVQLFA
jgi:hypothetical protein